MHYFYFMFFILWCIICQTIQFILHRRPSTSEYPLLRISTLRHHSTSRKVSCCNASHYLFTFSQQEDLPFGCLISTPPRILVDACQTYSLSTFRVSDWLHFLQPTYIIDPILLPHTLWLLHSCYLVIQKMDAAHSSETSASMYDV